MSRAASDVYRASKIVLEYFSFVSHHIVIMRVGVVESF